MNKNNLAGLLTGIVVGCIIVCIIMYFKKSYKKIGSHCSDVSNFIITPGSLPIKLPDDSRVCTNFDTSRFLY
tara:strand:+ start:399 stop:614 length:216 start_codon:yes stop_codon:yes gene_type:complete